jgi:large subunit ribosomal protein L2
MKTKNKGTKKLYKAIPYNAGRDNKGRVSVRHRGGRVKRYYRVIDFKRDKLNVPGKVVGIEYDPFRGSDIALIQYKDGSKRFILAPVDLKVGQKIVSGPKSPVVSGNALPLSEIPVGIPMHNIELQAGKGGQIVRGAGLSAFVLAHEGHVTRIKLPSGEVRLVSSSCYATIGQLSNVERKNRNLGKAGKKRYLGIRPTVRGVAQDPRSHPHGGGEGRSGIGMPSPKSPWGKPTLGKRTRRHKPSDVFIITRRTKKGN